MFGYRAAVQAVAAICWVAVVNAAPTPRAWQPLILRGSQVPSLLGASESHLEVLAVHAGQLTPIPFQVDEKLPDGSFALPRGPEPVADDSPGILDGDDEIVMMIFDLGEPVANTRALPKGTIEIEMSDPLSGEHRYAYLAAVKSPRLSSLNYVDYQSGVERIESDRYRLTLKDDFPVDLALQNRKYEDNRSIIDGCEVRAKAKVLGLFELRLNQDEIKSRVLAWRAGPIRVIRRVSHSVKLLLGIHSPGVTSEEIFYRDYVEAPSTARISWLPRILFDDVRVFIYLDYVGLHNFKLTWSGNSGPPISIGDHFAEHPLEDGTEPTAQAYWLALSGGGKLMLQTFVRSPGLAAIDPQLYFRERVLPATASGLPDTSGADAPAIGYLMTGWQNLPVGIHRLTPLMVILSDRYNLDALLRELAVPPTVRVRSVSQQPQESAS